MKTKNYIVPQTVVHVTTMTQMMAVSTDDKLAADPIEEVLIKGESKGPFEYKWEEETEEEMYY